MLASVLRVKIGMQTDQRRGLSSGAGILSALLLVNVVNFIDRQLPAILAEHIKRDLHLTDTQLGLLTGLAFALVYGLAALPLAQMSDRGSPRNVLVLAVVFWSGMTGLGAIASNFLTLALTRTGVALGEAASTPSIHVIITRRFPSGLRGRAIGIVSMGAPIGIMLGMALGGWISDVLGWRAALAGGACLGMLVAIGTALAVPDQRGTARDAEGSAVAALIRMPAFRLMLLAMCLYGLSAYSFLAFIAAFLIRVHELSAAQAGLALGLLLGFMGLLGTLIGGWLFDRGVRTRQRRVLWWPSLSLLLAAPATAAALLVNLSLGSVLLLLPFAFAITFYAPALFSAAHLLAGPGREATASSLLMIAAGIVGGTAGPVLTGFFSDALAPALGADALRWALMLVPLFAAGSGVSLLLADGRLRSCLTASRA